MAGSAAPRALVAPAAFALFLALPACASDDENRPPQFFPDANLLAPRTCGEVRTGTLSSGDILLHEMPAGCGAEGQECPVYDLPAFAQACKQGLPFASCQNGRWVLRCDAEAGVLDATPDTADDVADASMD
jgi:hypothetical protein